MFCFIKEHQGICEGILFIDSTHRIAYLENKPSGEKPQHVGSGIKLHLVINHHAEIVVF